MENFYLPLLGGVIIGAAVSLMLYLIGRVTGVSGIIGGALLRPKGDLLWRIAFVIGLILGGFVISGFYPSALTSQLNRSLVVVATAGFLVGFGTVMGNGCTSGHGICGISRLSIRSIIATVSFMAFGILSATFFRIYVLGGA